ncbi:FxSxx-COOH system tetratricopeptide repeat protein [Streptomycetaceae bacterium NBC_01309]
MREEREISPDDLTAREIADAVWLASSTGRLGGGRPVPGVRDESAPEHPYPAGRDGRPPPPDSSVPGPPSGAPDALRPPSRPGSSPVEAAGTPASGAVNPEAAAPSQSPPVPAHLDESLALARALRPLRARSSVYARRLLLDEDVTAHRIAETGLWLPVFRAERTRPWDEAVLVVDDSPSMRLWDGLEREVGLLLGRLDVFRGVRTIRLATGPDDADPGAGVPNRSPELRTSAGPLPWGSLTRPAGGRVVLMLTDGLGPAWRSGAMEPLLHRIGRAQTLAIVQTMPYRSWRMTGIATTPTALRRHTAPATNSALRRSWGHTPNDAAALPVPVLRLEPRWLSAWARLVAARSDPGPVRLPVMSVGPTAAHGGQSDDHEADGQERVADAEGAVRRARAVLAPDTYTLAVRLAAVPLSMPVIRAVQHQFVPRTQALHVAELIASGLVRHVPDQAEHGTTDFPFEFRPGVRAVLLAHATRQETWRVLQVLGRTVPAEDRTDAQRFLLATLDGADAAVPAATDTNHEDLAMTATVLDALAGPYRVLARRVRWALRPASGIAAYDVERVVSEPTAARASLSVPRADDDEAVFPVAPEAASTPGAGRPVRLGDHASPAIWGNVPQRNRNFVGRAEYLEAVHDGLGVRGAQSAVHALIGMGGVGKSQIAVEYVHRHAREYDLVWWLPAWDHNMIAAGFSELAQRMGLPGGDGPATVRAVLEALRGGAYGSWLLVFDNAEDVNSVRLFMPAGGPGSMLVTARSRGWAHAAPTTEVDVFRREESIELLHLRTPHLAQADAVAEALGDLPLAVEQASVWLYDSGMPADAYLSLFEQRFAEILRESVPLDYEITVAGAWRLSLDTLREANPAAADLLFMLAWLGTEPVPLAVLRATEHEGPVWECVPRDPVLLARCLRDLNRYALVRLHHQDDTVQVHRLVSRLMRDTMDPEARDRTRSAARDVAGVLPPSPSRTAHLLAALAIDPSDPRVRSAVLDQLRWLAEHAYTSDEHRLARTAHEAWQTPDAGEASAAESAVLAAHLPPLAGGYP